MKILELIISKNNKVRKAQVGNDFAATVPPTEPRVDGGRERKRNGKINDTDERQPSVFPVVLKHIWQNL